VKFLCLTEKLLGILTGLSQGRESGIPGVGVKSVDIGKNTDGEGGSLALN